MNLPFGTGFYCLLIFPATTRSLTIRVGAFVCFYIDELSVDL